MRQILLSIAALLISIAILILANGLQGTLIGVRAKIEGFSTGLTGLIISAYSVGHILGAIYTPALVIRVGHIRVFAALASIASAASILFVMAISPASWIFLRILTGACLAGLFLVVESWLNGKATNQNRGTILAIYMVINYGAVSFSQQLLNVADPAGIGLFVLSSVLFSIALVPVTMTRFEAPHVQPTQRMKLTRLFAISPMGALGALVAGFTGSAFTGMAPVYGMESGYSTQQIAIYMSALFLGGMLFQPPLGWVSDRMDRRDILIMVCLASALTSLGMMVAGNDNLVLLNLLCFVFGGFVLAIHSLSTAHTNDMIDQADLVQASSALLILLGIGSICGPIVTAAVMDIYGPKYLFVSIICATGLLSAFGLYRMTQRKSLEANELSPYVPIPVATQRVSRLDPRVRFFIQTRRASKKLHTRLKSLTPKMLRKK